MSDLTVEQAREKVDDTAYELVSAGVDHASAFDWGSRGNQGRINSARDEHREALDALIAAAEARGRASVMPSLDAVVWLASKTGFAFTGLAAPLRPLVDASADWTTKRRHAAIDEVVAWFRAALSTPEVPRG